MGFDFEGTYTSIVPNELIEFTLGDDRGVAVRFVEVEGGVNVTETFEAENELEGEQQRLGWQAILDRFAAYVEGRESKMNWTLEVVIVPVSDVDQAKQFYAEQVGFNVDHDTTVSESMRVVQLTPPGSGCSIVIGTGISEMPPGSLKGLQLVVNDIQQARSQLLANGVAVSDIVRMGENRPDFEGEALDFIGFIFFDDPDGNRWAVQQISTRQ